MSPVRLVAACLLLAACAAPKGPNSSTSSLPSKLVPGVPCYRPDQGGRIMQMDPNIAKFLGGYTEVTCP